MSSDAQCRILQLVYHLSSLCFLCSNSYRNGGRAPALVPELCSQQLANVNLPDMRSRVGTSRQQQFPTACE